MRKGVADVWIGGVAEMQHKKRANPFWVARCLRKNDAK
ncbi:hypothetical protein [Azospirillum largimobile]